MFHLACAAADAFTPPIWLSRLRARERLTSERPKPASFDLLLLLLQVVHSSGFDLAEPVEAAATEDEDEEDGGVIERRKVVVARMCVCCTKKRERPTGCIGGPLSPFDSKHPSSSRPFLYCTHGEARAVDGGCWW
jgi:hypothetical protein